MSASQGQAPMTGNAGRVGAMLAMWLVVVPLAIWGSSCNTPDPHAMAAVNGNDCASCHQSEFEAATQPLHVQQLPLTCEECHAEDHWKPARGSEHEAFFPLVGAHAEQGCGNCHKGVFGLGLTPNTCIDCHERDYELAARPPHDGLSTDCAQCHTEQAFSPSVFDHSWPLEGEHIATACGNCHGDPAVYEGTSRECVGCHQEDYDDAVNPPHDEFSTDCASCHKPTGWSGADPNGDPHFVHPWPLVGHHEMSECAGCHGDPPTYAGISQECVACHRADYESATNPSHDGFSTDCMNCHTPHDWKGAGAAALADNPNFMHPWPLVGNHEQAACTGCHLGDPPVYAGTSETCVDCHRADYDAADNPSHEGFSMACNNCHTPHDWKGAVVNDPNFMHPWPLVGNHEQAACSGCHVGDPPVYAGTSETCVDCHRADYDAADNPSHEGFSTACNNCHTPHGWEGAVANDPNFVHPWPLEGNHSTAPCTGCHVGSPPQYAGTSRECVDCHRSDYDGATSPSHAGFSTDCASCHSPSGWPGATVMDPNFVHPWPLNGAHGSAACSGCHIGTPPVYAGTPKDCVACHASDRDGARNPSHVGFSDDCASCHVETAFTPSTFSHPWPLTGAHQRADCALCHTGTPPVYAGTPQQCIDCHRSDYNGANPDHSSFPTDCTNCHMTEAWQPATGGNHPTNRFPINGRHDYQCNECHNPALGAIGRDNTDCVGCHTGAHTLARMAGDHNDVGRYPNNPAAEPPNFCLDCHPDGRE